MSNRILDATDVASNTDRFCDPCKEMLTETRERSKLDMFSSRLYRGRILAKGSGYQHPQLFYRHAEPTTCELCIFLRVELGHGADRQLPLTSGTVIGFALPGRSTTCLARTGCSTPDDSELPAN